MTVRLMFQSVHYILYVCIFVYFVSWEYYLPLISNNKKTKKKTFKFCRKLYIRGEWM